MDTKQLNKFSNLENKDLQAINGGKVNPTCGALVTASVYLGLSVAGPVGVGIAIAAGATAAGSFCR